MVQPAPASADRLRQTRAEPSDLACRRPGLAPGNHWRQCQRRNFAAVDPDHPPFTGTELQACRRQPAQPRTVR
ncbi:MAG: hypothetical protein C0434_13540 [Xanthomonadaceae bacterium]|nr:hypothetical protein [Xanthomonadaceae bacterium]